MKTILNKIALLSKFSEIFLLMIIFLILPQINIQDYVLSTITSKLIYFLYSCIVLLAFYSFSIVWNQKKQYFFSKLDLTLFILLSYITINRYFIQSHYGFSIRYVELLGLSFLYIVLRRVELKNYTWLLLSIVVSGIIQSIYGVLQLLGYYASNHLGFKMTGSFFNPGPYAGFLVSVWAVNLGMYLFKENITAQVQSQIKDKDSFYYKCVKYTFEYIPVLGLISIAIVLPALQSRASWIAAIVGSVVLVELRCRFLSNLLKKVITKLQIITLIVLSIGIISAGLFSIYHYKKPSSDGRAFIWKVITEMIIDNPVFGVGFDRFKAHYMNYQANYFAEKGETSEGLVADNVYYAFNEGLQFVSENGFIGLVLLLFVIHVLFLTKFKEEHQVMSFIAKTGLLTIGIFACFSYPMQILPIKIILVILIALLSNASTYTFQVETGHFSRKRWMYKIITLLLGGVCIYQTISFTNKVSQGFIVWNNALIRHQYGGYKESIVDFEKAYPIFNNEGDFLMNYGKTLSLAGESDKAITVLEQARHYQNTTIIATTLGDSYKAIKDYDKAELAYQQAINMIPGKFYVNYLLAKLYDDSGQKNKAVAMANKLIKKQVKIPSTAIEEIQREMKHFLIKYKNPPGF